MDFLKLKEMVDQIFFLFHSMDCLFLRRSSTYCLVEVSILIVSMQKDVDSNHESMCIILSEIPFPLDLAH